MSKRQRQDGSPVRSDDVRGPQFEDYPLHANQADASPAASENKFTLTDEEALLYDRQLRIWGVEAQQRMRQANVLVIGSIGGLAAEVCKNITLSGLGAITLCDSTPFTYKYTSSANFLAHSSLSSDHTDSGKGKEEPPQQPASQAVATLDGLKELNPNVHITAIPYPKHLDTFDFSGYSIVFCVNLDIVTACAINTYYRQQQQSELHRFYYAFITSSFGILFLDYFQSSSTSSSETTSPFHHIPLTKSLNLAGITVQSHPSNQQDDDHTATPSIPSEQQQQLSSSHSSHPSYSSQQEMWAFIKQQHPTLSRQQIRSTITSVYYLQDFVTRFSSSSTSISLDLDSAPSTSATSVKRPDLSAILPSSPSLSLLPIEFSPLCAIFGGIVAQEILRAFSDDYTPLGGGNWVIFDLNNNACFASHLLASMQ